MNRKTPILILVWVFICCAWWACFRKPACSTTTYTISESSLNKPINVSPTKPDTVSIAY